MNSGLRVRISRCTTVGPMSSLFEGLADLSDTGGRSAPKSLEDYCGADREIDEHHL